MSKRRTGATKFGYLARALALIMLAGLIAYFVATGMKFLFEVPRPCELLSTCPDTYSFPSRHTVIAFSVAAVIFAFVRNLAYGAVAIIGAAAVAYWRLAIGVHTVEDVLVGAAVGAIIGYVVYFLFKRIRPTESRRG